VAVVDDASAVLASAEDRVIDEAVAALTHSDPARESLLPDGRRREVHVATTDHRNDAWE
jgi:hypothetical protein